MQLFIDSTSDFLFYVIRNGAGKILSANCVDHHRRHTTHTVPILHKSLLDLGYKFSDIDELYIISGPGLYTSTRVGVVFAKTLALLNPHLKLFTLNSLHFQAGQQKMISIIPANRLNVYLGIYDRGAEIIPPQIIPYKILEEFCAPFLNQGFLKSKDYSAIDYTKHFIHLIKTFKRVINIDDFEPFYLKSAM